MGTSRDEIAAALMHLSRLRLAEIYSCAPKFIPTSIQSMGAGAFDAFAYVPDQRVANVRPVSDDRSRTDEYKRARVSHAVNSGNVRQVPRGSSPAGKALDPRHSNRSCARAPLTITISLELGAA